MMNEWIKWMVSHLQSERGDFSRWANVEWYFCAKVGNSQRMTIAFAPFSVFFRRKLVITVISLARYCFNCMTMADDAMIRRSCCSLYCSRKLKNNFNLKVESKNRARGVKWRKKKFPLEWLCWNLHTTSTSASLFQSLTACRELLCHWKCKALIIRYHNRKERRNFEWQQIYVDPTSWTRVFRMSGGYQKANYRFFHHLRFEESPWQINGISVSHKCLRRRFCLFIH